jgi:hypothetical protein
MAETQSKTQILLVRLVIVLMIAFTGVGVFWYGFSEEVRHRVWEQLIARPTGPMAFRFILQPIMAAIAALRDGVNDAKSQRQPETSLSGMAATPLLKGRQQVLKRTRYALMLKPSLSFEREQHRRDRHWRGIVGSAEVLERGKGEVIFRSLRLGAGVAGFSRYDGHRCPLSP